MDKWFDLLREFFGVNLNTDRAATWVRLLKEPDALPDVTETELCNVLRWVRKQREGDSERRVPTLETLIGWVKWYRKESAIARRGYKAGDPNGFTAVVKAKMRQADTNAKRWDIMCDPRGVAGLELDTTVMECDELMAWAERNFDNWLHDVGVIKDKMSQGMKTAMRGAEVLQPAAGESEPLPF